MTTSDTGQPPPSDTAVDAPPPGAASPKDEIVALRKEIGVLKRRVARLTKAKDDLTATNAELTNANEELTATNAALTKANDDLIARVDVLDQELAAAVKANQYLTDRNAHLEVLLRTATKEIEQLSESLDGTREELVAVRAEERREEGLRKAAEARNAELVADETTEDTLQQILNITDDAVRIRAVHALTPAEFVRYAEMRQSS